jgi:Enoyl-(Acyl carrier protein) reductase
VVRDPARWPELYTSLPAGRVGQPTEVAAMAAFLASPKSSYTSGVVITLDAGISSRSGAGEGRAHKQPRSWVSRSCEPLPDAVAVRVGAAGAFSGWGLHIPTPGASLADPFQASQLSPGPEPDRCRSGAPRASSSEVTGNDFGGFDNRGHVPCGGFVPHHLR